MNKSCAPQSEGMLAKKLVLCSGAAAAQHQFFCKEKAARRVHAPALLLFPCKMKNVRFKNAG